MLDFGGVSNSNPFHQEFAWVWCASSSIGREASRHSQHGSRSLIQASSSALEQRKCCWEKKFTPLKTNMDTKTDGLKIRISFSRIRFSYAMFVVGINYFFGGVRPLSQSQWAHNIIDHDIFCRVIPFQLITGKGTTQYIWGWAPSQDSWQGAGLAWDSLHVKGSNTPDLDWHPEGSTPTATYLGNPLLPRNSHHSDLQLFSYLPFLKLHDLLLLGRRSLPQKWYTKQAAVKDGKQHSKKTQKTVCGMLVGSGMAK